MTIFLLLFSNCHTKALVWRVDKGCGKKEFGNFSLEYFSLGSFNTATLTLDIRK